MKAKLADVARTTVRQIVDLRLFMQPELANDFWPATWRSDRLDGEPRLIDRY
jgi:hypothetical protein